MTDVKAPPSSTALGRRTFLTQAAGAGLTALLAGQFRLAAAEASASGVATATASDVGSLFPFIQSQAVKGEFPLSFLNARFRSLKNWKKTARGKLLELLHYSPSACAPSAETVERVDCGDYVREKVLFNTTPDVRVPAF